MTKFPDVSEILIVVVPAPSDVAEKEPFEPVTCTLPAFAELADKLPQYEFVTIPVSGWLWPGALNVRLVALG